MILDRKNIFKNFPWIKQKNKKFIISADYNGLICASFLSHILNWELVGYYNLESLWISKEKTTNYNTRDGVVAHTNTKYKGVMNMRYWINELIAIQFHDLNTINELKSFVRYPNGTWSAKREGEYLDDRVMALIWTLIVLESTVTERYYEVIEYDDSHKPRTLRSLDYGIREFVNPLSIYANEKSSGLNNNALPVLLPSNGTDTGDIDELKSKGWLFANPKDDEWVKTFGDDNNIFLGGTGPDGPYGG